MTIRLDRRFLPAIILGCFVVAGCPVPDIHDTSLDSPLPTAPKSAANPVITAQAGVPVKAGQAKPPLMAVQVRADPFALTPTEASYEKDQLAAYLTTTNGNFPMYYQAPPPATQPPNEPPPFRRLAGIMIGDSVTALMDTGSGELVEIHPGQIINGWEVVSIDSDKAVLRRVGSNALPTEVTVRLQSAPVDQTPAAPTFPQGQGGPPGFGPGPSGPFRRGPNFGAQRG